MKAVDIQESVQKYLYEHSHLYQVLNFSKGYFNEADILAITKSLLITEVEVKISLADYKKDFTKTYKHYKLQNPNSKTLETPNRFYYACPYGLIKEVPTYAGLMYIDSLGDVEIIKKAPLLHKNKATEKLLIQMLNHLT